MVATIPSPKLKSSPARTKQPMGIKKARIPALSLVPNAPVGTINKISPSAPQLSLKIQFLLALQKGASLLSAAIVLVTLGVYAWTVYVPKLWSKEFRKLETLQSNERQLVAMDETLKNQLAQQAEDPKMGLVPPHPSQPLFLAPAPLKTTIKPNFAKKLPLASSQAKPPLAY